MKNKLLLLSFFVISIYTWGQNEFITTWKTDNPGTSNTTSITIPIYGVNAYNYDVDWDNDGTFDQLGITGAVTHDFGSPGIYTIRIQGQFPSIHFNGTGDRLKILNIEQWGNISWLTMFNAFNGCQNLTCTATDVPDLSAATTMNGAFYNATIFNGDLSNWDVSNISSMSYTFGLASNFNSDISNWDLSNCTTIQGMFWDALSFNQDISLWNVSIVENMNRTFDGAINFDQNIGNWNMTSVTDVTDMFLDATLSTFNYNNLLLGWSSQVLQLSLSFNGGNSIYSCNVQPNRDSITSTFGWSILDAGSANCDTTSFITTWKTDNPGTSNSTSITIPTNSSYAYFYDVDWDNDGTFDEFGITGDITHDFGSAGIYTIAIQGQFESILFNNGGDKDKILDIAQWGNILWMSMDGAFFGCSNLISTATDQPDLTNVFNMNNMFENAFSFTGDLSSWNVSNVTNTFAMFHNCYVFNSDLSNWNVTNLTDITFMFWEAYNFNSDLSNWNVTNVTNMVSTFDNAYNFNSDLGNWNVSNVSSMSHMFWGASSFDQNLGNWNMSSVIDVTEMFAGCTLSTPNYDSLLIGWSSQALQPGLNFDGGFSIYNCSIDSIRTSIMDNFGWTIADGGTTTEDATFDFNDFCFGSANSASNIITPGGVFSFNPSALDGASINPITGEITNGVSGGSYTIEYTTPVCSNSLTKMVNIVPKPTINLPVADDTQCSDLFGLGQYSLSASYTGATGILWTSNGSGGASEFDDNTSSAPIFSPNPADIPGTISIYGETTGNGVCPASRDTFNLTLTPAPSANAGLDINSCNTTNSLNGSITIATGAIWTSLGDGFFSNNVSLTSDYTFGANDISNGFANIILTTTGNGTCNPASDTMTITITPQPIADAGLDINSCNTSNILNGAVLYANGGIWSTNGDGVFSNDTSLNSNYTFGPNDITNGFANITLTTTGNGSCNVSSDIMTITLTPQPIADAGLDINSCDNINLLNGGIINASGGIWSSTGDGIFSNNTDLNSSYTFGPNDITNGFVNIILTTTGNGSCSPAYDTVVINLTNQPIADAGLDISTCSNSNLISLSGNSSTGSASWSTNGSGTFTDPNSLNTDYTISTLDTGAIEFYLSTTNNGSCISAIDTLVATIIISPIVNAGKDTIIEEGSSIQLNGNASSGDFSWVDNSTLNSTIVLTPIATPTITTTYILSSSEFGCISYDSVLVTVIPALEEPLEIRNLITPNNDGKNDFWTVSDPEKLDGCRITVLNRWGNIVYESTGYQNDWGGTNNGDILQDGTYYYFIDCETMDQLNGTITLIKNK